MAFHCDEGSCNPPTGSGAIAYCYSADGVPAPDSDGDTVADCVDGCADDPDKTEPGTCGCGTSDGDSDGDGYADCIDPCPDDPAKQAPGGCGCGVADTDTDGDGIFDCSDVCSAGDDHADRDGDGTADACDACPDDVTNDSDGDGACDGADPCPADPLNDSDHDGICDGVDLCLFDTDTDGDLVCNKADICPLDIENDADHDGVCEVVDNSPVLANDQRDQDQDGLGDACDPCTDPDRDRICSPRDVCPGTQLPERTPRVSLGLGRWAEMTGDGVFESRPRLGRVTVEDTRGCSCEQIVAAWRLGSNELDHGCRTATMLLWSCFTDRRNPPTPPTLGVWKRCATAPGVRPRVAAA